MKTKFFKCTGCGRIHVGITKSNAATEVRSFNEYFSRLSTDDRQSNYGGRPASIEHYKKCHTCGTPSDAFVPAIGYENSGMTMQTVIEPSQEKRRPIIFLDMDDVLTISREYTSYQVITAFKLGDLDGWPELWSGLIFAEARDNLAALHSEFWPQYVVSSSWSNYLTREQLQGVFRRTGLGFVAGNMHKHWTTPKGMGSARVTEIENWISQYGRSVQPVLVLDDHESGWNLHGSSLDQKGHVVLCEPWIGFVTERLVEAQVQLRAQVAPGARLVMQHLRPLSAERIAEIVRARTSPTSCEQLALGVAGQGDEVRPLPIRSDAAKIIKMTTIKQKSKLLARWLRHRPDAIALVLDKSGWADIAELLAKAAAAGAPISSDELMQLVIENDKQRFTLSPDGLRIRAAQGHSVAVDLKLPFKTPPPVLYHGTVRKFLAGIRKQGLLPGSRRDVHLSATRETAVAVGARRGASVVLVVETYPLVRDGFQFRCADNGVWLIPSVPPRYLRFPDESPQLSSRLKSAEALHRVGAMTDGQLRAFKNGADKAKK